MNTCGCDVAMLSHWHGGPSSSCRSRASTCVRLRSRQRGCYTHAAADVPAVHEPRGPMPYLAQGITPLPNVIPSCSRFSRV